MEGFLGRSNEEKIALAACCDSNWEYPNFRSEALRVIREDPSVLNPGMIRLFFQMGKFELLYNVYYHHPWILRLNEEWLYPAICRFVTNNTGNDENWFLQMASGTGVSLKISMLCRIWTLFGGDRDRYLVINPEWNPRTDRPCDQFQVVELITYAEQGIKERIRRSRFDCSLLDQLLYVLE